MKVPFLDLQAHHQPIREQLEAAIGEVIDKSAFAGMWAVRGRFRE